MMTVLVTGGTGYIGSHTCVELFNAGYDVVILDNLSNSKPEALSRIKQITGHEPVFYKADILNIDAIQKVFDENAIDSVIHFAGLKAVGESVKIPMAYYNTNVTGTLNLCAAMAKAGCKHIVFSSSATVYGNYPVIPFCEDFALSATSPYGWTKLMIEQVLRDIAISDPDWSVSLLRYFNPVGAHESGLLGENPNGIPNNLMPYIAQVATGKLPHLNVFGNDYDTPDGTGVRDYLHVVDLAKGHIKALEYIAANKGADAVNLGTGKGSSVLDMVNAFERASGVKIPYEIKPRRAGDIGEYYADAGKAKQLLGWEAEFDIEKMCADTWNFTQKNPNGL